MKEVTRVCYNGKYYHLVDYDSKMYSVNGNSAGAIGRLTTTSNALIPL